MNATTVLTPRLRAPRPRAEVEPSHEVVLREEHRWELLLVPSFCTAAIFFALAIETNVIYFMGPAVVLGPIAMMFALIYLCISSDSNGTGWEQV